MAVLTLTQKEIVAAIEREFIALNESTAHLPFNIVDVNKLNTEINRQKVARQELTLHNEGMNNVRKQLQAKIVEKLNADFQAGGLQISAVEYSYDTVKIMPTRRLGSFGHSDLIEVYVHAVAEMSEFGGKTIGFEYSNYSQSTESRLHCKTVEELFLTDFMQKRLIWVISKV